MPVSAYEFWQRVDEARGTMTLKELCERSGVKYTRVRNSRSEVRFPKNDDMELLATNLGTTCSWLMFGDQSQETPSSNTRADAIIERLRTASDLELTMVEKILGIGD